MKKIITVIFALLFVKLSNAQAPDSWTEKNGLGLNVPASSFLSKRHFALGFNVGSKGYIGTGKSGPNSFNDFIEYDPVSNSYIGRAKAGLNPRYGATGFSIGTKGYVGTGYSPGLQNDFWEFDPVNNSWTQKANFGGSGRWLAVGFCVGNKGYIGTGYDGTVLKNDFWEYDPVLNTWTQKANFGGTARLDAVGFCIGSKGYIGTGTDSIAGDKNDFWEYDPATNLWTQKANYVGGVTYGATGFNIGTKGYLGLGYHLTVNKNDFWEFDPVANTWTQKTNFGGTSRGEARGFCIGNKGYITAGYNSLVPVTDFNDIWEYDPTNNSWTMKLNFGESNMRSSSTCFSINNKGYLGTGYSSGYKNDFWEYDPVINVWTQKANFSGTTRSGASGFSIGAKGYIGTGYDGSFKKDFYEYDPVTNVWTQKADFGGTARQYAVGFSISNRGYLGTGDDGALKNDFWEYDPSLNTWTQKANFTGTARKYAVGFTIGNKGYLGTGDDGAYKNDFREYDPVSNSWTSKANFGGTSRRGAVGFTISDKGYVGTGYDGVYKSDFWEYDAASNFWTQKSIFPDAARALASGMNIGGKGYIGSGQTNFNLRNDFWEYTPVCSAPVTTIYSSGSISFCSGDSVFLYANNGYNYQWKKNGVNITGATSYFYYAKTAGSYTCYLSNSCGAVTSGATTVIVNPLPSATITPAGLTTFCSGGSVVLNAPTGTNKSYQWKKGANLISGATLSSYTATGGGNYKVIVTNTVTGCSKTTASATVVTVNALPSATITPQGPTTFCAGGSVVLAANTGAGLTYKWKKGSNFISGATLSNYTATVGGNYKVQVTNSNGCTKTSAGVTVTVPCRDGEILAENSFDVNVFPNPSSGDFTFEFKNTSEEKISVHIYDVMGKLVLSESIHNSAFIIHNSKLTPGIYSAVITNGENEKVLKLVKTNK